jgi:hypothetical protein
MGNEQTLVELHEKQVLLVLVVVLRVMAARYVMMAMTVKAIAMVAEVQIGATALVTRTAHA